MPLFYAAKGTFNQKMCVYKPYQNGIFERKHQQILNVGRALEYQSSLSFPYWDYHLKHACYFINITPSPLIQHESPYVVLYPKQPDYTSLKVFGCLVYVCTIDREI